VPLSATLLFINHAVSEEQKTQARSLELNEQGVTAVKKGQYEIAEQLFRRAIGIDPGNLTAVHNLAGMYIQNQRPDNAINLINSYKKNDPEFYIQLGDAYFVKRDSLKARTNYETALKIQPKAKGISKKVASVCLLEKDFTCAQQMLERASVEQPNDAQVFANLTSLYLAKNDLKKAINAAKRSLQLTPSGEVYGMLGDAYASSKQKDQATEAYRRALSMGYEKEEMEKRIKSIEEN
jgi:Flp pilus assembly protein TadD